MIVEGDTTIYAGALVRVSPAISVDNRTLAVEVEVPNQNGLLRPGTFARANIIVQSADSAVMVPASSIVTFAGIDKVITVKNNVTEEKQVRTGRRSGTDVEIVDGLNSGETVVLSPGNLVAGEPVAPQR